ncbi:CPXCG motif-containing cysteine-rich protein [Sediminicola luteus]|uniref:CPXCG motif-containing cysteine-rich protein n=1 Tax=Sediminicola luteus TaxID=319238 RepID=A0A2A4GCX9_9FLAO|nr:CPXCG motif-containing cysteine-rich protein [Sediminicola luteus]PCE65830.1 CPXCG motif-containing cysteine-rich protein [Sediminicola luteus]
METRDIQCPHCWEYITIALDVSVDGQTYVEDCQVCCRPLEIDYTVTQGVLASLSVAPIGQ